MKLAEALSFRKDLEMRITKLKKLLENTVKGDTCGYFSEGLAFVEQEGKYGYINRQGTVAIPLVWSGAYPFTDGIAEVFNEDGRQTFLDKNNRIVIVKEIDCSHF